MKRKLTKFSAMALTLVFASALSVNAAGSSLLYGDVNSDSKISIADATAIQSHLASKDTLNVDLLSAADYNGDSKVDVRDVTDIQKTLADLDYKYTHEAYPVTFLKAPDNTQKIDFTLDKACTFPPDFGKYYFNYGDKEISSFTTVFTSYKQYKAFFDDTFDEYDEDFFADKALVYVYRYYTSSSIRYSVKDINRDDSTLYLSCVKSQPALDQPWEEALANINLFLVVDKADVEGISSIAVSTQYEEYSYY